MTPKNNPQLPPITDIEVDHSLRATTEEWFEYPITVHPHHTDYAGVVWHGNYIPWLEEARIEYLRQIGIDYVDLVNAGCELPVVEINLRYHQPLKMGQSAIVKTRLNQIQKVRMHWDYEIVSFTSQQLYLSGRVTLVGIDTQKGKILRQLPPILQEALIKMS
ncbi:acyl-CoA thioesterase [Cyanobacterium stanieri LEGE 03274]|uniref:Acyl-CoA thioesterase n=1 Tax=Cyanobacterium stanieri LEGE 03274 TaxID=1828756 RepID=A0ABR9V723_9CHRO|nr:thioesterase family protein [Cyanobacterium stanieri]MBE9223329.1 acyl-CoA thioesterase [Cyanobacterium stanieri LEGE 03274]